MVFILTIFKIVIFTLCLGVALSVLVYVPLFIYVIPYALWVGFQNQVGKHKDKKDESVFRSAKNATKLYSAWICRREPNF